MSRGTDLVDDETVQLALLVNDAQVPHEALGPKRLGRYVEEAGSGMTRGKVLVDLRWVGQRAPVSASRMQARGRAYVGTHELLLGLGRLGRQHDDGDPERLQLIDLCRARGLVR
jgi:hypothetical protein